METTRSFSSSTLGSIFASATRILPLEKGAPPPSRLPCEHAGRGARAPSRRPCEHAFAKTPGRRREPRRRVPSLVRGTYTRRDRTPRDRSPALSPCPLGARRRAWRRRRCLLTSGVRGTLCSGCPPPARSAPRRRRPAGRRCGSSCGTRPAVAVFPSRARTGADADAGCLAKPVVAAGAHELVALELRAEPRRDRLHQLALRSLGPHGGAVDLHLPSLGNAHWLSADP